jgi:microcystin-dependent protein
MIVKLTTENLKESGGTVMSIGSITEGQTLKRSGSSVIGTVDMPAGTILPFGGTVVPTGFLACDGSNVSRSTYATLYAAIGTTWGVGDNSTTFTVPDLRRRSPVGSGGSGTAQLANSVGSTGGAESVTLTTTEMPAHNHGGTTGDSGACLGGGAGAGSNDYSWWGWPNHNHSISSQGGGAAHNNYHPSAVVLFIIKT